MEAKDKNIIIAKWLGLEETKKGSGIFKIKGTKFAKFCNVATTSELKFNSDWNWLMYLLEEVEKYACVCVESGTCSLFVGGTYENDTMSKPDFSCCRTKSTKMAAIYEVCGQFVLYEVGNNGIESDPPSDLVEVKRVDGGVAIEFDNGVN